jgi:hypothetical protein
LGFWTIGQSLYRPGSLAETFTQLAKLSEIEALQYSVDFCHHIAEIICQDAPDSIREAGIEVLIVDQLEPVGETIAEALNLPFVCVSRGQVIHRRADVPPFFTPWGYQNIWWVRSRPPDCLHHSGLQLPPHLAGNQSFPQAMGVGSLSPHLCIQCPVGAHQPGTRRL